MRIAYAFLFFLMGTILGSFFNVIIYRLPRDISIIKPHSFCPNCKNKLDWYDMIPLLSYIFLKGKCRHCKSKISIRYPAIEFLTGITYTLLFLKFGLGIVTLKYIILFSLVIITGVIDLFEGVVPDQLTIPGMIIGLAFSLFRVNINFFQSILGLIFMGVIFLIIILISKGGMGQGDVTFGAMIGSFLGFYSSISVFVLSFIVGAIFGIYALIFLKKKGRDAIPFGPYLALSTYLVVFFGNKILELYYKFLIT